MLTPEEWVRQHVVNYLIVLKKYPLSLISVEKEIVLNGMKKRYDIVVYDRNLQPDIIIECKGPDVLLTTSVLEQALRYNLILESNYVVITNGMEERVFHNKTWISELPEYSD